ncbi:MAG: AAA family ATPase [Lentisphaerae bacterium]|jgi:ABC-type lipoprotein export system ATPase subunit/histidinol phosphatase-like PHP family hydrolase|nr:AAA family ATPase [Lentisphaerota bacterium]
MTDEWYLPGSKWWKFDFHTHTPKSNDYGHGDESFKNIKPEEWLRKAMESGLDCVAVTDHNAGGWIDELKAKNKELRECGTRSVWYKELTIFPGVEITVGDSGRRVHLLAVFDPSCDSQKANGVLGACGITSDHGDDQKTSTTKSFIDTVQIITKEGGVAIAAHIDGSKGLLEGITTLTPELEKSLNEIVAAEFCDLHKFDNGEPTLKKEVGRLAKVAGSDAHKPEEIGRYFSWLKMSRPSIEGLRLALMDHEFCVKNQSENPNRLPDIFLSKLTIKDMRHCGRISGQPFVIKLHPHFNSIIGGRGTGKSTVLESIRIVSRRDQNLAVEAPRVKNELDRFMQLSQNKGVMLNETEILLELHRRGKNYQLRWRFDGQGATLEEKVNGAWQEVEAADLSVRFPTSIFSQKQINELASNPRGLLEIVDRSPEVNRAEWNSRWESVKSQFLQLRERRRELLRQLADEQQIRVRLGDVENDLKQYEEKGHGEILKQYQKRSQQKNGLPDDQVFDDLASGIRELASSTGLSDFPAHLFDDQDETTAEIKAIHEQTAQELKKISDALGKLADSVDALKAKMVKDISSSKWHQAVQASIAAYDGLVKEYEEKKSQLSISLYGEWVSQRNQLQQQLKKLDSIRKEAESTEKQIEENLAKLQELRNELLRKRRNFLNSVIGNNAFVRMELVQYGDVSTLEDDYRSILNLEDGRFASSICDRENKQGLLWKLNNWEEAKTPESDLPELISQIKAKTLDIAKGQLAGNHGMFDKRLKKQLESQPAIFDRLDAWWPEDMLRVKYSKDPSSSQFDDLEKGSAGQKAAAILAFLLSHGDEPLIIDQPEDDLDNALIYDLIVKQIHENKNGRQLIIVTHNPNIVVNGDSELVHVLKFENGQVQIDQQGGLEESNIREAICTIMEGGRQALEKRYKRMTLEV